MARFDWVRASGLEQKNPVSFINREDVDFDTVESMECTQEGELARDAPEPVEYNTRSAKKARSFSNGPGIVFRPPRRSGRKAVIVALLLTGRRIWRRITKFGSVRNLTLYIPENYGEDVTRVYYIGLKGEWTEVCVAVRRHENSSDAWR
ncbi:MAG: hypothetical protein BJ554DRAFT_2451 [Olpidium bornovanus]|uniref:PITH domain-containing protein n=1 Tax=Olpidium bornovanus TaxID=278681 RepID=A0A8H8DGM4_9FUNG|nr:MAG: hypothetical protein BJ554DRAFT_2451 [Olpidium bornovanus]